METTFISIHDLSVEARVLYASDSILDILGYAPDEVIGKSCFEYFHPDEIPFARSVHGKGVELDKAAVLSYCRIRSREGQWIGCECVFTIVYDVLVASTSIYRRGLRSQKRAAEAPIVRRLFSSTPLDPRYHMLSLLSAKFSQGATTRSHEPRAAMFLNRFTRTLTIMYSTNALATVLGLAPDEVKGKSFYECIQENCLADAIRCLESAKANDSIAYMRFWFRDPRQDERQDERMSEHHSSDEDEGGGVYLDGHLEDDPADHVNSHEGSNSNSRASSGHSTEIGQNSTEAIFGEPSTSISSSSSLPLSTGQFDEEPVSVGSSKTQEVQTEETRIEVEAVVSCTSDGLVVILRRARPITAQTNYIAPSPVYVNGLFASPWAATPIMPPPQLTQPPFLGAMLPNFATTPIDPYSVQGSSGPPMDEFMHSIREVAVFAWALTGINGSLAPYGRGRPTGESQPPGGLPVWSSSSNLDRATNEASERMYGAPPDGATDGLHPPQQHEFHFVPSYGPQKSQDDNLHLDYGSNGATSSHTIHAGANGTTHGPWDNAGLNGHSNFDLNGNDTSFNFEFHAQNLPLPVSHLNGASPSQQEPNALAAHYLAAGGLDGTQHAQWGQLASHSVPGADNRMPTTTYVDDGQDSGVGGGQYHWL
ncbi:MAG: hypothetical protein M1816_000133 [Peltula sp. TS41687]|nr:MAG: hypothetical protein M1816_000133 [Peltula sp. TS41687]